MEHQIFYWLIFGVIIFIMLVLDLFVFNKKAHEVKIREAFVMSIVWISLALVFNLFVYQWFGKEKAMEFLAAYVIEESLSVDNLFVFILIFNTFNVKPEYQHKVLFWGILGAIVMRLVFIAAGVTLLYSFSWIMYLFGVFLIYTGIKIVFEKEQSVEPENNRLIRFLTKKIPVSNEFSEDRFFVKIDGKTLATPLFITLIVIEFSDLIFAVDSIPAVLSISDDIFIIYSSNIFAILGLRSLYFALAATVKYFRLLKYGLAVILSFVGIKMCIAEFYQFPIYLSLLIIVGVLICSILASFLIKEKKQ